MSHGAGLVRTTCSSGSAPGAGAGAGPLGASSAEGLLDPVYPRTQAALLKVAQMVVLLMAFICVRCSVWTSYSAYSYFEVVTICNLIMILTFYLVHLFRLYRMLTCISWPLSELLHYLIGTLLLLIASIVAASKSYSQSGLVAGAIFGFLATFLCLASVWLSYKISCMTQSTDAAV
ncbi:CKLF-like MARVEL transmembrane domain-containing protein 7 isoform X1 [Hippopotamus amphibius kiboko]|uniref:CKLF-like MARVEL transmembrane domain-containing protein 7 isoform X1 n=1 Tax=Hippopotamus amphibius kiboko TaxID=575201 RepID=UPI0025986C75|nr:CKLF-like MARVEL transmembrane domain-containing protein 7 isoform X1 [Hippopotamus amphibius kiboko]